MIARQGDSLMAMKETEGSLRAYLVIAGAVAALWALRDLSVMLGLPTGLLNSSWLAALWFPILTHIPIGIGFVAAGLKLKSALLGDPTWILRLLQISGAILLIQVGLTAAVVGGALGWGAFVPAAIGILITWYLYASVNRLSREAKLRTGQANVPVARVLG
jgi:hypothetical protein